MGDMHFTEEETSLVEEMAKDRHGIASRLGFYASVLVPVFIFGIYGMVQRDILATVLALVGLAIFVVWRIAQESKYVGPYKSIFQKVLQHQRDLAKAHQAHASSGNRGAPGSIGSTDR